MKTEGVVGRFFRLGNSSDQYVRLTDLGSVAVDKVKPDYGEVLRAGLRFGGGCQVIANGIAPVAAIPTTTATLALWNGENDDGACYLVDRFAVLLGSGTPAAGLSMYAAVSPAKLAAPTAATNYSSQSLSIGGRTTKARWATAQTFAAGAAWTPVLCTFQAAAANVGQGDLAVIGTVAFLVPPGYALGFGILSGAGTTPLYQVYAHWTELQIDRE